MANRVKSKYLDFYTDEFFHNCMEEDYSNEKFEEMYRNHPSRLSPDQVKGMGYDVVRSQLWSRWIDTKYNSLYVNELAVSNNVIGQMLNAIKSLFPDVNVKVWEGEVKKYGDNKFKPTRMCVGDYDNDNCLTITPTLSDKDNTYFYLNYCTPYREGDAYVSDEELIDEIAKYVHFVKTGEEPTTFPDKVCHKYENQYKVYFGKHSLGLYDIAMVNLYNTLAKEMNKHFGTDYKYSQKMIDRMYKLNTFGNISYIGGFVLQYVRKDNAELHEFYFYEDDKSHKPDFKCWTTYGEWKKEDLIELLDTLQPYVMNNYFVEMSKKAMRKKYDSYDRIGIGYRSKPDYFDIMKWEV